MSKSYNGRCKRWLELGHVMTWGPDSKRYFKRQANRQLRHTHKKELIYEADEVIDKPLVEAEPRKGAFAYVNGRFIYREG